VLFGALIGILFLAACGDEGSTLGGVGGGAPDVGPTASDEVPSETELCGNGALDPGEACDGVDLGGASCQTLGFNGGQLGCHADCTLDPSGCQGGSERLFGQRCGGPWGSCTSGLLCVLFNEGGTEEGYCTAECNETQPCPGSPVGAQCVFQLVSSGSSVCGFLCGPTSPICPSGLACSYSDEGQYHYCSTDPPAQCGNNKVEFGEECDGVALGNMSCEAFGYEGGQLTCGPSCTYDKDGCAGSSSCANLPPRDCTGGEAQCSKLVLFSPTQGAGYEVTYGTSYSWARQDTMMLIQYAAASVACMMPGSHPLGLGDMSMQNGSTPMDAYGNLRHPQGTHDGGRDVDLAYYQVGQPDNHLRPVCPHSNGGQEQYHCVGSPSILDAERTALFLAKLLESSRVRVVGVDGQIGPLLQAEAQTLHGKGLITSASLAAFSSKLAYETSDTGMGWYLFHHHHMHLSTWTTPYATSPPPPVPEVAPDNGPGMPVKMQPKVLPLHRAHQLKVLGSVRLAH
jgi:hypothetical protein